MVVSLLKSMNGQPQETILMSFEMFAVVVVKKRIVVLTKEGNEQGWIDVGTEQEIPKVRRGCD
jgi:hypothetical protein